MDDILQFLTSPLGKAIVAALIVAVILRAAWSRLFPAKAGPLHERVRCPICGWIGTVGKYTRKCAKCGSTTLENVRK